MEENLLKTCLYDKHVALGALMSPFGGFIMPIQYTNITDEHNAVRHRAGMFDVSHMGEIFVSGPDADKFVNHVFSNDVKDMEAGKILYGGPMMGTAIYTLDAPILKNTNAVTVLNKKDAKTCEPTPCIHCGRCVAACPMGLNPTIYSKALNLSDAGDRGARLESAKVNLCIECGCCSFVCPAKRPLVENNRQAKAALREIKAKGTGK